MQIKKLSEVVKDHKLKIMVYGQSGVGKTSLIGTLPGRVLILSAEAGLLSLARHPEVDRFDVVEISTLQDLKDTYRYAAATTDYSWLVLDSVSEIAEIVLAEAISAGRKSRGFDPRQAYGALIETTTELIRAYRDLKNLGVVLIFKESVEKEEGTGKMISTVSMPGSKLGGAVPYLFDLTLRLTVDDVVGDDGRPRKVRQIVTEKSTKAEAKDRSGMLLPIEEPDLGAILAKIQGVNNASA